MPTPQEIYALLAQRQARSQADLLSRLLGPTAPQAALGLPPSAYLGSGLASRQGPLATFLGDQSGALRLPFQTGPRPFAPPASAPAQSVKSINPWQVTNSNQTFGRDVGNAIDNAVMGRGDNPFTRFLADESGALSIPLSGRSLPEGGVPKFYGPEQGGGRIRRGLGRSIPLATTADEKFLNARSGPGYDPVAEFEAIRPTPTHAGVDPPLATHVSDVQPGLADTFESSAQGALRDLQAAGLRRELSTPVAKAGGMYQRVRESAGGIKDSLLKALGGFAGEELGALDPNKIYDAAGKGARKIRGKPPVASGGPPPGGSMHGGSIIPEGLGPYSGMTYDEAMAAHGEAMSRAVTRKRAGGSTGGAPVTNLADAAASGDVVPLLEGGGTPPPALTPEVPASVDLATSPAGSPSKFEGPAEGGGPATPEVLSSRRPRSRSARVTADMLGEYSAGRAGDLPPGKPTFGPLRETWDATPEPLPRPELPPLRESWDATPEPLPRPELPPLREEYGVPVEPSPPRPATTRPLSGSELMDALHPAPPPSGPPPLRESWDPTPELPPPPRPSPPPLRETWDPTPELSMSLPESAGASRLGWADRSLGELAGDAYSSARSAPGEAYRAIRSAPGQALRAVGQATPAQIGEAAVGGLKAAAPLAAFTAFTEAINDPRAFGNALAHPIEFGGKVASGLGELGGAVGRDVANGGIQAGISDLWHKPGETLADIGNTVGTVTGMRGALTAGMKMGDTASNLMYGGMSGLTGRRDPYLDEQWERWKRDAGQLAGDTAAGVGRQLQRVGDWFSY